MPQNSSTPKPPISVHSSPLLSKWLSEGVALHEIGKLTEAQDFYRKVLTIKPDHCEALQLLGTIEIQMGNYAQAVETLTNALQIDPKHALTQNNIGVALECLKNFDAAIDRFNQAINLLPEYAEAYFNRGNVLREQMQYDAAIDSYNHAIRLVPNYSIAYYNRGNAFQGQRKFEAAIDSYEKAITSLGNSAKSDPSFAPVYYWRGVALHHLRKIDAAIESYEQAISTNPNYVEAICDSALAYLLICDFDKGWTRIKWRWEHMPVSTFKERRFFNEPLWLGNESLAGKTILLYAEQGFGDTIMFSRYAKLVSDLGAKVILEVQPQLVSLLKNLEGISQIATREEILPKFDYHTPLLSLPLAFHTNKNSIPSFTKCIHADPIKVAQWQEKLGEKLKPRVGLVWSGSEINTPDASRSMQLNAFIPYLSPSVSWISLKNELSEVDKSTLHNNSLILDFADDLQDFSDTAALIECLDLVITVDTSVAHLSAALGKKTWVLLPYTPDWRWQLERDDSPWYPSIKLYRQPSIGDWTSVLEKVKLDLIAALPLHLA